MKNNTQQPLKWKLTSPFSNTYVGGNFTRLKCLGVQYFFQAELDSSISHGRIIPWRIKGT